MLNEMISAINAGIPDETTGSSEGVECRSSRTGKLSLTGEGEANSCYAVAEYSQSAIAAAVYEVQEFRFALWNLKEAASVNRELAAGWCSNSIRPIGWPIPAAWDEFASDYQCRDGWIRLHTNAPHHRQAALNVLGNPADKTQAEKAVAAWNGLELEQAVVAEGGASAFMMSESDWQAHENGKCVNAEPVVSWWKNGRSESTGIKPDQSPERPLAGVKVLDLTRVLAGPVCTRFLASLGAHVLRIDPPDWEEDGNALEMTVGKRCAALDLNNPNDFSRFKTLLQQADVLVHGYRADALEKLGLGNDKRQLLNPGLIDIALNAYGWTGPWRNRRGFDSLVQMSSGIAHKGQQIYGNARPTPLPYQALDHVTGYLLAAATVRALTERHNTGSTFSGRLSLARQAKLLQDLTRTRWAQFSGGSEDRMGADNLQPLSENHISGTVETTPWGALHRLRLPYELEGVRLGFDHPVSRLKSVAPQWAE